MLFLFLAIHWLLLRGLAILIRFLLLEPLIIATLDCLYWSLCGCLLPWVLICLGLHAIEALFLWISSLGMLLIVESC